MCRNNTISNNYITAGWHGIQAQSYDTDLKIYNNVINYTVDGYDGIYIDPNCHGAKIYNNTIINAGDEGIWIGGADDCIIENNTIWGTSFNAGDTGIYITAGSDRTTIRGNIVNSSQYGIWIDESSHTILENNSMKNKYSFVIEGDTAYEFNISADKNNTIHGKPIYYLTGVQNTTYDSLDIAMFGCYNCYNVTVRGATLTNASPSIMLYGTSNSVFEDINITLGGSNTDSFPKNGAVYQFDGTNNSFTNINITNSDPSRGNGLGAGFLLRGNAEAVVRNSYVTDCDEGAYVNSSNNKFINVTFFDNDDFGVYVYYMGNNSFENCTFNSTTNDQGTNIKFQYANNNTVKGSIFDNEASYSIHFD